MTEKDDVAESLNALKGVVDKFIDNRMDVAVPAGFVAMRRTMGGVYNVDVVSALDTESGMVAFHEVEFCEYKNNNLMLTQRGARVSEVDGSSGSNRKRFIRNKEKPAHIKYVTEQVRRELEQDGQI